MVSIALSESIRLVLVYRIGPVSLIPAYLDHFFLPPNCCLRSIN